MGSVADQGSGIPKELDKNFQPFYRVDKARSKYGGAGLGLALRMEMLISPRDSRNQRGRQGTVIRLRFDGKGRSVL